MYVHSPNLNDISIDTKNKTGMISNMHPFEPMNEKNNKY